MNKKANNNHNSLKTKQKINKINHQKKQIKLTKKFNLPKIMWMIRNKSYSKYNSKQQTLNKNNKKLIISFNRFENQKWMQGLLKLKITFKNPNKTKRNN